MSTATLVTGPGADAPARYRWTVDALYRAIDAGVFDRPERVELVHGELIERMGQSPAHASIVFQLANLLRAALGTRFLVREEKPLHIDAGSEPISDIVLAKGARDDYKDRHPGPTDAALLIEVADTSASYDAGGKALLYAQAGIAEYWVVLLVSREILVHRQPAEGGYLSIKHVGGDDEIAPIAATDLSFTAGRLLGG